MNGITNGGAGEFIKKKIRNAVGRDLCYSSEHKRRNERAEQGGYDYPCGTEDSLLVHRRKIPFYEQIYKIPVSPQFFQIYIPPTAFRFYDGHPFFIFHTTSVSDLLSAFYGTLSKNIAPIYAIISYIYDYINI